MPTTAKENRRWTLQHGVTHMHSILCLCRDCVDLVALAGPFIMARAGPQKSPREAKSAAMRLDDDGVHLDLGFADGGPHEQTRMSMAATVGLMQSIIDMSYQLAEQALREHQRNHQNNLR